MLWQYFHVGIPSHHFLADESMPKVSNAWGALTIPITTVFLFFRMGKRLFAQSDSIPFPMPSLMGFVGALLLGFALGMSLLYGWTVFLDNVPFLIFGLALFFPTYRSEYFLGFVLGLTYFIGGVLPVVVGAVFLVVSAVIYLLIRPLILRLLKLINKRSVS